MTEPNTLLYYLKRSTEFLEKKGIPNPRIDAEWLLSDLLNLPRIKLYSQFEMPLSPKEIETYRERIVERSKKKPVAYITGKKGFHKYDFYVNKHTLIPRPETEELVDWFYKDSKNIFSEIQNPKILDLCTGSGCIAVSLSRLIPQAEIWATDISNDALEVAKTNDEKVIPHGTRQIHFLESDLFKNISPDLKFHAIVSNPPYIPSEEKKDIMEDVLNFEPHLALFVDDFKIFHSHLLQGALSHLVIGGILALETHPDFAEWIMEEGKKIGYSEGEIKNDSSHKQRFVVLKK
ncbi:peptide chain release factor N(5)-glutamine methyltransferase [Leptospira ilyithenensis]|uniref:Release factor glutamine methyltransferase n=1 Tax=Leptospira ilyithenensis TaxID=2484901 RepID=A0A4R9LRR5_9LEPT|nr:peptide chain release factor N(5)-glutamine methyltransferase [Leptospira ilyithenensis]TGN11630.1 peptide chain release factor N(5)-glutamine methyltransferase [Leptospira ilyithenensis]